MKSAMRIKKTVVKEIEASGLGERIRLARKTLPRNGKSLDTLCSEAGISRTYWYEIESERVRGAVSAEVIEKIEQALGVDFGVKFD